MPHFYGNEIVDDEEDYEMALWEEVQEVLEEAEAETGIRFASLDEMHKWFQSYWSPCKDLPLMEAPSRTPHKKWISTTRNTVRQERKKSARFSDKVRNMARNSKYN